MTEPRPPRAARWPAPARPIARLAARPAVTQRARAPGAPKIRAPSKRRRSRSKRRLLSPLMLSIMIVNVVALIILVGGVLYLNQFQDDLVEQRIETLASRARIVAGALGESAVDGPDATNLTVEVASPLVDRLLAGTGVRALIFSSERTLLIDSRDTEGHWQLSIEPLAPTRDDMSIAARVGLRLEALLHEALDSVRPIRNVDPAPSAGIGDLGALPEVGKALGGETLTVVRLRGDGVYALYAAVPIQRFRRVVGALLLTGSTEDIGEIVRTEQIQTLKIFAAAVFLTLLLSFFLGRTLVRPIRRLAEAAENVRHNVGAEGALPTFTRRADEIGDLSRSLSAMTRALYNQIDAGERFAADVAHELKNPLSSMRSALETLQWAADPDVRDRLLAILADDVQRLDRLIVDISEASRLDAELTRGHMKAVDLSALLGSLVESYDALAASHAKAGGDGADIPPVRVSLEAAEGSFLVSGIADRLGQVWRNLIDNAISFSAPGGDVRVSLVPDGPMVDVLVEDEGPGLPEGTESKIFKRFYSERPDQYAKREQGGGHSGLGLAISRQIVEAHGGRLEAENRLEDGEVVGARFTVSLPVLEH